MRLIVLTALTVTLLGCKAIPIPGFGPSADNVVPVPLAEVRLLFGAPAFEGRPVVRAEFADNWQRVEYALFQGPGAQAEAVYIAATARETSLSYSAGLKSLTESWNHNANVHISWGEQGTALSPFGPVYYVPFFHLGEACFGYSAEWAVARDDPSLDPTKVTFGYYCETAQQPFSDARIRTLVGSIEVSRFARGRTTSIPVKSPIAASGGKTGNPDFPFQLAHSYFSEGPSLVDRAF